MSVYKRGKTYWIEFQVSGQRIRQSARTTSKREAQKVERELRYEYARNLHNQRTGQKTYADALLKWLDVAPESMLHHARATRPYLDHVKLINTPSAAHDMKVSMKKKGLSPQTINRRLAVVRRILNLCYKEWGWLEEPLGQKISTYSEKGYARELYLSPEEVTTLLDAMKNEEAKKVVVVACYTGLRKSELLSLTAKNWQPPNIILEAKNTKSKKTRVVPVVESVRPLIDLPFKVSEITLRRDFNQARKKIERPEIRFHDLRHSFASWLAKNPNIPMTVIRDLMGHSSLSVTSRYAHLRDDHSEIMEQSLPTFSPTIKGN